MKVFTGWEYLLIDCANHFGLDKLLFEERIDWATTNLPHLEALWDKAEAQPLFIKSVMAIRRAQRGEPIGHLVHFDAVCSGMQIMSALTGCMAGARATGLIDPNKRADAYTEMTSTMNALLTQQGSAGVSFPRDDVKRATMTSLYGSTKVPEELFGEDTVELQAFYQAGDVVAPGAFELLNDLISSWQPYALSHEWHLPDGFLARVKVMETIEARVEVDELHHSTFTYMYKENQGKKKGVANAANVVHSIDGYVLRTLVRRCNYDAPLVQYTHRLITAELLERQLNPTYHGIAGTDDTLDGYLELYSRTRMADTVILPYLHEDNVCLLSTEHLQQLNGLLAKMLEYYPFPVITIHDSFACHPNNMNVVRYWYKEILAELADSTVLDAIMTQIHGQPAAYVKLSHDLGKHIRANANYALC